MYLTSRMKAHQVSSDEAIKKIDTPLKNLMTLHNTKLRLQCAPEKSAKSENDGQKKPPAKKRKTKKQISRSVLGCQCMNGLMSRTGFFVGRMTGRRFNAEARDD